MAIAPDELIVDLFAGGGGASQGIFEALGRHPDIAVNHDEDAIAVHTRNHQDTAHLCASVWKVEPRAACAGRPVGLLWASPDCRHFSRAAGATPKSKSVRSLPGVVLTWATRVQPRVIVVENVREFLGWGPLLGDGTPCPDRVGRSFNQWVGRLRALGYTVQWRELCAADFGAPTIRTRLFVVARRDGQPIRWPHPTHARRPSMLEKPWLSAASCIDWDMPAPSIFTRARPLKPATLKRIADGVMRYVVQAEDPFIVPNGVVSFMSGCGGRASQSPSKPVTEPFNTVTAKADQMLVSATLMPITHQGERRSRSVSDPVPTLTCANRGEHAIVTAFLAQHNLNAVGRDARQPLATITTAGTQIQAVTARLSRDDELGAERCGAFLAHYYSNGGQSQDLRAPLGTATTKARFALVVVRGVPHPIVDIGMRMLTPGELQAAQGFPTDYDMSAGGKFGKTTQIRLIGNSVCPPVAAAVMRSIFSGPAARRIAA